MWQVQIASLARRSSQLALKWRWTTAPSVGATAGTGGSLRSACAGSVSMVSRHHRSPLELKGGTRCDVRHGCRRRGRPTLWQRGTDWQEHNSSGKLRWLDMLRYMGHTVHTDIHTHTHIKVLGRIITSVFHWGHIFLLWWVHTRVNLMKTFHSKIKKLWPFLIKMSQN